MAPKYQTRPQDADLRQEEQALWACDLRDGRSLAPGLLNDARNVRYPEGRPETRKGVVKPGWANRMTAGSDVITPLGTAYGAGVFRDPNGTIDWQIVAADGYAWRTRPYNQNITIPLPAGVKLLSRCVFVQAFNKLYCFRGRYVAPLRLTNFDDGFEDILPQWSASANTAVGGEVAYGPFQSVSTPVALNPGELTSNGLTATVTHAAHGLNTGDSITIFGANESSYNGTFTITVLSANVFTYSFSGDILKPWWYPDRPPFRDPRLSNAIASGDISYVKSGLTRSGNTATVVTAQPHGYVTGADITIRGANDPAYNGRFNITVLDDETFTYAVSGTPVTPETGTIICSNMSYYYAALGTLLAITSLTRAGATATATAAAHGFATGQTVTIAGASDAGYNGIFTIISSTPNTFDYNLGTATPATPATLPGTVRNGLTLAGQSPDSHPANWQRVYGVLPNADTALFTNNRLLVPTAYTPDSTGYNAAGATYTKVDFLVATDIQDEIHFTFNDEFRINQGSADEIVDLANWGQDAVIIWKNRSWGVLSGLTGDLTDLRFDLRSRSFGLTARGAWAEAGETLVFLAERRGFVYIQQTASGKLNASDVPLSAPIQKLIDQIDWRSAAGIRCTGWNSHIYASVPIPSISENCVLVFSFVGAAKLNDPQQGWTPLDTGSAFGVLDWFKLPLDGVERLCFISTDGWVNLMEESDRGDQIAGSNSQGLGWEEIATRWRFRPQGAQLEMLQSPLGADIAIETFNPKYSIAAHFEGVNKQTVLAADVQRSNVNYFKPWNATAWDPTNLNADHDTPYREDYRVGFPNLSLIPANAVYIPTGAYWITTLTVGATYVLTTTGTELFVYCSTVTVDAYGTPAFFDPVLLPVVPNVPLTFVANATGLYFGSANFSGEAVAATLILNYVKMPGGIRCLQFQESLCHFRMSGRQGRSVAIELTNTQGRVRWQGLLTRSRPGRQRLGIQV